MVLYLLHGAIWVDEGVIAQDVRGGEGLSFQAKDPVRYLAMKIYDKANLFAIQGM